LFGERVELHPRRISKQRVEQLLAVDARVLVKVLPLLLGLTQIQQRKLVAFLPVGAYADLMVGEGEVESEHKLSRKGLTGFHRALITDSYFIHRSPINPRHDETCQVCGLGLFFRIEGMFIRVNACYG